MATSQDPFTSSSVLNFVNRFSLGRIVLLATVLFLGFGILWWNTVYTDPARAFHGMLENSLRLKGVTRHIVQTGTGQDLDQYSQLSFGSSRAAESRTTLTQEGSVAAIVKTQSLGTATHDYVRYTSIDTDQKTKEGKAIDFSNILGVWGNDEGQFDGGITNGELYNELVLGVVPFGDLPQNQRAELLGLIRDKNIYEINYQDVKEVRKGLRTYFVYKVSIDAEKYVTVLKEFAALAGLNHLEQLDPSAYAGTEKLGFEMTVDVLSRQLTKIVYGSGERVEELSGHNVVKYVALPTETIGVQELQERLQQLQQ